MPERRFTVAEIVDAFHSVASLHERVAELERALHDLPGQPSTRGGMPLAQKILLSRKEAAAALGLSEASLVEAIHGGLIEERRMGRKRLVHRDEIARFSQSDHEYIWLPKAALAEGRLRTRRVKPEAQKGRDR